MTAAGQRADERARPTSSLAPQQIEQLRCYHELLLEWNTRVNLVSRRLNADAVWSHIEHCLTVCIRPFAAGARVVDWGTGGGLPAVPIAVAFPDVEVIAVDSTLKKIRVLTDIVRELGLVNVTPTNARAESWDGIADISVSRATAQLESLWPWHRRVSKRRVADDRDKGAPEWHAGLLALKGGELQSELADLKRRYPHVEVEILDLFSRYGPGYEGKVLVHVR